MRCFARLALVLLCGSAVAQEGWPEAGTPLLTVVAGDVVVRVPAPAWLGDAAGIAPVVGDAEGVHADWAIGKGLDMAGSSLDVRIDRWDDARQMRSRNHLSGLLERCRGLTQHRVPPMGKRMTGTVAVCGDDGANGVIFISRAQQTNDLGYLVEYWYRFEYEPFDRLDPAAWPVPEAAILAMAERISSMVEITIAGVPEVIQARQPAQ